MYMASLGSKSISQTTFWRLSPTEQRILNAVEPPARGAMKFLLPSAAMHLERNIAKTSAAYVLFLHAHCVLIYFCVLRR
jgi:hypothetical protein